MCAGAVPIIRTDADADEPNLLLLAFTLMVSVSVYSNVPEPVVPGLAAPPEPFLFPMEPVQNMSKGHSALIHKPTPGISG